MSLERVHDKSAMTGLRVDHLALRAGNRTLIRDLTLSFAPGELWCVAGPNGAGKTTLITALAGLSKPASGAITLDGIALRDWRQTDLARRRALMPQAMHDAFSATVFNIVMLNRFPHLAGWGWEGADDRAAAHAALDALGLSGFASRDVLSLSGGERQRVALAAALCQDAPLLLLDEPLSHLDLHHQIDCLRALERWTASTGSPETSRTEKFERTVVFSCHDLNLARRFATHALLLDSAGNTHAGPAREVLTPERASAAFGYPLALIRQDDHEALVPVMSEMHVPNPSQWNPP
jgi:iron complex transport system ATP-binding protein